MRNIVKQPVIRADYRHGAAALVAVLVAGSVLTVGCAAKPVAKTTGALPAAPGAPPPLAPGAAEAQIRSVQENKKLPESAKAGIIAEIRSRQGAASPVPGN
jgi:hypothetical protein